MWVRKDSVWVFIPRKTAINSSGYRKSDIPKALIVDCIYYNQAKYKMRKNSSKHKKEQSRQFENIINNTAQTMAQKVEPGVRIQPQGAIVFYRNQYQSAATISIFRQSCQGKIRYTIKTSNKKAYLVSSAEGIIMPQDNKKYIDIMINQNTPLQQCVLDRFQLLIQIQGRHPIQKKFKVIIDYKKDSSRIKQRDFNGLQVASKTSASVSTTATPSILSNPVHVAKKSMFKQSKLVSYLPQGEQNDRINFKQQLDQLVKQVENRRSRLQYLKQQILKNRYRKKFGCYITIFMVLLSFLLGIGCRKAVYFGLQMTSQAAL